MNIGEFGNFLSYAYAPASVVAPLGTVSTLRLMYESWRLTFDFLVRPDRELYIRAANFG
jgi:Magnesium transporter NIPA